MRVRVARTEPWDSPNLTQRAYAHSTKARAAVSQRRGAFSKPKKKVPGRTSFPSRGLVVAAVAFETKSGRAVESFHYPVSHSASRLERERWIIFAGRITNTRATTQFISTAQGMQTGPDTLTGSQVFFGLKTIQRSQRCTRLFFRCSLSCREMENHKSNSEHRKRRCLYIERLTNKA